MPYEVSFENYADYIHATVTGTNSRDAVIEYMADIRNECTNCDCFRVLIEEKLEGPRLQAMDIFSIASEGSMKALGLFEAIAYVDEKMGEMRSFAETVAVNRGMPIATFSTLAEAKNWLVNQEPGVDEQKIFWDPDNRPE